MIKQTVFSAKISFSKTIFLVCGAIFFINTQTAQALAATLFDVEKILADIPPVISQGARITLRDGQAVYPVRVDSINALSEVHKRLGETAKLQATLLIAVNPVPNASAIPLRGKNIILVSTGMLDILGADKGMIAALLGHEYAHHLMRHSLQRILQLPEFVYGAVSIGNQITRESGSQQFGKTATNTAFGMMFASFKREQEAEADKVGTELMADAKYDPEGTTRLITTMLKLYGAKPTGYFDSHPGFEERLTNAAPTVLNQRYDSIASDLKERKDWRSLRSLVDQWLKASPESARAWYYRGTLLKVTKGSGALEAFEKSVDYDRNFIPSHLALCIELYMADRKKDSLSCAEYLPKNAIFDEYIASTFKHVVHVGGLIPRRVITDQDVKIINQLTKQDR